MTIVYSMLIIIQIHYINNCPIFQVLIIVFFNPNNFSIFSLA